MMKRVHALDLPFNRYGIDPYGIQASTLAEVFTVLSWLYYSYFRVHVSGLANVPSAGRSMLVGNHSGGWALDGIMTMTALFLEPEPPRLAQGMAERFIGRAPLIGQMAKAMGAIVGIPENATHLLEHERLLLVYPEGAKGTEKLYSERNSLVDFGTGFLRLALRTRTPIIPVAFVGGGEAIPTIFNLYKLARRLGVPYIPITPWGLAVPRPTTLQIYFGEPIWFEGDGNEEDVIILRWVNEVKEAIAKLISKGVEERHRIEINRTKATAKTPW
ncbi:MAG: 1-acyl-sn-glycerol-3-phosphate acyltransferase [Myxococcales bacterium]|nr:1-acyl-sn-glycerol-3-phosphate acyltransferase [Myxococcales bacterium]